MLQEDFGPDGKKLGVTGMAQYPLVVPEETLTPDVAVIDIVTAPEVTELVAAARARGCLAIGGGPMLNGQLEALTSFWLSH